MLRVSEPVRIVPLTADVWPSLADLFSSGGDARWCWCRFWRKPGSNWSNTTAEENRRDLEALVGAAPAPGLVAPGLVALRDGVAVGWVGLGPRSDFPRLGRSRTLPQLPGEVVWVVNCFVAAKAARRSGVASALLEAAVAYAREHGARLVEGSPALTGGERMSSASAYMGTEGMFARAGFDIVSPTTSKADGGRPRVVMRREA